MGFRPFFSKVSENVANWDSEVRLFRHSVYVCQRGVKRLVPELSIQHAEANFRSTRKGYY